MKICVAQTRPDIGAVSSNIIKHKVFIELAAANHADMIIFPELSLTGYEPKRAKELATGIDDKRLSVFQRMSDDNNISIGVGFPELKNAGVSISMIIFQPGIEALVYSKKYLHPDEDQYFIPGENFPVLSVCNTNIGLAICFELSITAHSAQAFKSRADVYIASVAKTKKGVEEAAKKLSAIARKYSKPVFLSNCVGYCDDFEAAGNTSVWNNKGELKEQLDSTEEGIIIMDTVTGHTFRIPAR